MVMEAGKSSKTLHTISHFYLKKNNYNFGAATGQIKMETEKYLSKMPTQRYPCVAV